jgi:hypothetical protein
MVKEFPVFSVAEFMARADRRAKAGTWTPTPPTDDNVPNGRTLKHALAVATKLGIRK